MGKHKSDDYKLSAVEYYLNMPKPSMRKTCSIFSCKYQSLYRWVKRYLQTNSVSNKPRKQGSYKIRKIHVQYILNLIKRKPNIMLWQILANLIIYHYQRII